MVLNTLNIVTNDFQMSLTLLQKRQSANVPLTQYFFLVSDIELGLAFALFKYLSMIPILIHVPGSLLI